MIGECDWTRPIAWTVDEGDAIIDCCSEVAKQLLAHNAKREVFCQ